MAKKIKCPICNNKYEGEMCPFCGAPVPRKKKSGKLKWILLVILALFILFLVAGSVGEDSSKENSEFTKEPVSSTLTAGESAAAEEDENKEFEEISVFESDDYTVKITDISSGIITDYGWTLYIENNTDKNVTVALENVSVDGAMADPF